MFFQLPLLKGIVNTFKNSDLSSCSHSSLEVDFGKYSTLLEGVLPGFLKPWHINLMLQSYWELEDIREIASLPLNNFSCPSPL